MHDHREEEVGGFEAGFFVEVLEPCDANLPVDIALFGIA
jgi:hypothetical protein